MGINGEPSAFLHWQNLVKKVNASQEIDSETGGRGALTALIAERGRGFQILIRVPRLYYMEKHRISIIIKATYTIIDDHGM
jgi:hypothetical protein